MTKPSKRYRISIVRRLEVVSPRTGKLISIPYVFTTDGRVTSTLPGSDPRSDDADALLSRLVGAANEGAQSSELTRKDALLLVALSA